MNDNLFVALRNAFPATAADDQAGESSAREHRLAARQNMDIGV